VPEIDSRLDGPLASQVDQAKSKALRAKVTRASGFIMKLAKALHTYGMPAHRLEHALHQISERLNVDSQYLVTPTFIIASIGPADASKMFLERVNPGRINLGKQTELHTLICDVASRKLTLEQANEVVDELTTRPPAYGRLATIAAFAMASASTSVFFDAGRVEVMAAGAIGLVVGLLAQVAAQKPRFAMVLPGAAGLVAVLIGALVQTLVGPMYLFIPTLAGLIILLPGLNLTIAVNELAHGQLVSGSARLSGALMAFIQIAFGVALGGKVTAWLGIVSAAEPDSLPSWIAPAALMVSALGMTVLFKARTPDLPLIMLAATVSFSGSRLGTLAFGPEIGVLLGAWLVGTLGHLAGRWRNHPSAIGILPGMLLLVPGGLSFTTLSALLANDPVSGIQAGFSTLLFALSLVTGLLLSSLTSRAHEDF
jgi:uncharacterized membrane protein YjjP (DUF1212 family)